MGSRSKRYFSASNLFKEPDYRDFFVWWDKENCHVPKGYDSFRVFDAVTAGLRQRGFYGRVHFQAALSLEANTSYDDRRRLSCRKIPFVPADPEFTGHNAADKKIKVLVKKWIAESRVAYPAYGIPQVGVLIITSDSGFSDIFKECQNLVLLMGLFYVPDRSKACLPMVAHFHHHWLHVLTLAHSSGLGLGLSVK